MRCFFYIICICLIAGVFSAQAQIKVGVQANHIPIFKINSETRKSSSSEGIRLVASNFDKFPAELGIHLSRGYDSSVNLSYGLFAGMAFLRTENHWFKAGLDVSRFVMEDYKQETDKKGGVIEDDLPTSFLPYTEWEWRFIQPLTLFMRAGYRIMASETSRVTDIKYETNPVTGEKTPVNYLTEETQSFYGSGLEFGVGLSVIIY